MGQIPNFYRKSVSGAPHIIISSLYLHLYLHFYLHLQIDGAYSHSIERFFWHSHHHHHHHTENDILTKTSDLNHDSEANPFYFAVFLAPPWKPLSSRRLVDPYKAPDSLEGA